MTKENAQQLMDRGHFDTVIEDAVDKAYPIFQLFGWTYYNNENPPTRNQLTELLTRLVYSAVSEDLTSISSGRFLVVFFREEVDYSIEISLNLSSVSIPLLQ